MFKLLIITLLIAVLVSLASGLFFLYTDKDSSTRVVKALTWRFALSAITVTLIIIGLYKGWIVPHPSYGLK